MLYGNQRDTYRDIFFAVWRKHQDQIRLDGVEAQILPILMIHPEYHRLLSQPERFKDRDYLPEAGESNPFLHMGMHLGLTEQVSVDQPKGISALYQQACRQIGDVHAAEHRIMECLAEMIWLTLREQKPFDNQVYLDCIRRQIGLKED